jgi:hypothetical protein
MIQQPLCHVLNSVLLFIRSEQNIQMENYSEIRRNFFIKMLAYRIHAIKFYFIFFLVCLSTRLNILLKGSISNRTGFCLILCYCLMKYLSQSHVVFTIYLYLFHFVLCVYILPCPVHSAMSEMHQWLAFAIPPSSCDLPRSNKSQITEHYVWYFLLVSSVYPGKFRDSKLKISRRIPQLCLFITQDPIPVSLNSTEPVQF